MARPPDPQLRRLDGRGEAGHFLGVEGFHRMAQVPYSILRSSYSIVKSPFRVVKPATRILKVQKKGEELSEETG